MLCIWCSMRGSICSMYGLRLKAVYRSNHTIDKFYEIRAQKMTGFNSYTLKLPTPFGVLNLEKINTLTYKKRHKPLAYGIIELPKTATQQGDSCHVKYTTDNR